MNKPKDILKIFEKYISKVEEEIKSLLAEQGDLLMYDMMSYFFGFLNENMEKTEYYGGKRFRPGICLLLSDFFGTGDDALEVATAIEIFHNFTLIHDDIADRDETRRARPTVWKKWGINHALNTGDAQLLLVNTEFYRYAQRNAEVGLKIQRYSNEKFIKVAEGQYLDFLLSELKIDDKNITEEKVFEMMSKKSGVLVGLPAALAGMVANKSQEEIDNLWDYGFNLGITYQLCDDITSIWGDKDDSGKDELADIREKKKTFPIIYFYQNSNKEDQEKLRKLYDKVEDLTLAEISEVKKMLDKSNSKDYVIERGKEKLAIVRDCINKMSITEDQKNILEQINKALFVQLGEI